MKGKIKNKDVCRRHDILNNKIQEYNNNVIGHFEFLKCFI
jgi:hypothetical protein